MMGTRHPRGLSPGTSPGARGRQNWFRATAFCLVAAAGCILLAAAEWVLRARHQRIQRSDVIEPGLLQHDDLLGWTLKPYATVTHRHQDFSVRYSINADGFRTGTPIPLSGTGRLHAIVGDSFTFGFGVNDNQTFVHWLNELAGGKDHFINCGVPGYSTDQETLLVERNVLKLRPAVIWLVVYLANDLIDNQYSFPVQANLPKPYFQAGSNELVLKNTPVPQNRKPATGRQTDLVTAVLGEDYAQRNWRARLASHSFLFRAVDESWLPRPDLSSDFAARLGPAMDLFASIIGRLRKACRDQNVELVVVLLPGASFVEKPRSVSAQYQEFFRRRLLEMGAALSWDFIDLGDRLRARRGREGGEWFYPHDGHLTPRGHQVVSEELSDTPRHAKP